MSKHTNVQFGVRTLLFITFVVAIAAATFQLSVIVGCLAVFPMAIALKRTLRCHRMAETKRHSLAVTYLQSLALLVGLFAVTISTLVVSTFAVALMSVDGLLRGAEAVVSAVWRRFLQGRIASTLLLLGRIVATIVNAILVFARCLAVDISMKLNRTNHIMATNWRHRLSAS